MSYGATVGASAANSNLIKKFKKYFYPCLENPMYTATFQSGLLTILKNANEFKLFVWCCCWYLVFTSVDRSKSKLLIGVHAYLLSCYTFLIYNWVGVNTKFTTWQM